MPWTMMKGGLLFQLLIAAWLLSTFEVGCHAQSVIDTSDKNAAYLTNLLDTVFSAPEYEVAANGTGRRLGSKKQKTFSYSLLGNGFLGLYGTSVVERLNQLGVFPRDAQVYGASSGAFLGASLCTNVQFSDLYNILRTVYNTCAIDPTHCVGKVDGLLAAQMVAGFPDAPFPGGYPDCKKFTFSMSETNGTCNPAANQFGITGNAIFVKAKHLRTKTDLVDGIRSSGYIPGFSGFDCYRTFKNQKVVDGGFVANSFCFDPKGCVKIYAFPPTATRPVDIYPGIRPGSLINWPLSNPTLWAAASFRADIVSAYFDQIVAFGRADADYWYNTVAML